MAPLDAEKFRKQVVRFDNALSFWKKKDTTQLERTPSEGDTGGESTSCDDPLSCTPGA